MKLVSDGAGEKLAALAILPTDERYGPPGHKDSNAEQLREAGFEPGEATWVDVLVHNVPLEQTIRFYNDIAATALASATAIIAQFGIGPDGHIAGILPDSPATEAGTATATGYETPEFTRITLTPLALKQVHTAYALAYGDSKKEALKRLQKNKESLAELPSGLLYGIPEAYVYNDQIESEGTR
jgi:6-phosphogluconolactonase/glucosamine-6-phosphate isomerase/deaminase